MKIEDLKQPEDVFLYLRSKGYTVFDSRPWSLNIIGARRSDGTRDNRMFVICKDDSEKIRMWSWSVTTNPGLFWIQSPINQVDNASLAPGQYLDCWQFGNYNGRSALKLAKPVKVYKIANKSVVLDIEPEAFSDSLYENNFYRSENGSQGSDKWSAGCQVFLRDSEFRDFLELCNKQVLAAKSSTFSYTLLEEE